MAISESFKQQCPSCEANVTIKGLGLVGKKVECPRCKFRFVVEKPKESKQAAAETAGARGKDTSVSSRKKGPIVEDAELLEPEEDLDEVPVKKSKKKKAGTSPMKLLVGVGLAIVGVGVLAASAYFTFLKPDPAKQSIAQGPPAGQGQPGIDPDAPDQPPPNIGKGGKGKTPGKEPDDKDKGKGKAGKGGKGKGKGGGQGQAAGVEFTNFLPRSSEGVFHARFQEFLESPIGQSTAGPGGLDDGDFKENLGFSLLAVDGFLEAQNYSDNWVFCVLHTTQPITDMRPLNRGMGLEVWSKNPTKHACYTVERNFPWINALRNAFWLAGPPERMEPNWTSAKSRPLLVHLRDPQTIIFSDVAPMVDYLRAGGKIQPNVGPGKQSEPTGAYLTVAPSLREMLLHVEGADKQKTFFSGAVNVGLASRSKSGAGASKLLFGGKEMNQFAGAVRSGQYNLEVAGVSLAAQPRHLRLHTSLACATTAETEQLQRDLAAKIGPFPFNGKQIDVALEIDLGGPIGPALKSANQLEAFGIKVRADSALGLDPRFALAAAGKKLGKEGLSKRNIAPETFPPGVFARRTSVNSWSARGPGQRISWMAGLLPYLGQDALFGMIDFDQPWRDGTNLILASVIVPHFLDPTFPISSQQASYSDGHRYGATHFVGISGVGPEAVEAGASDPAMLGKLGVFGYDRMTPLAAIKDKGRGLSNTVLMIRVPHDGPAGVTPWMAGGGSTVRAVPEKNSLEPFLSMDGKGGGTYVLMCDGSVRYLKKGMSDEAFQAICTVNGPTPANWKFDEDYPPQQPPKPPPPLPPLKGDPIPPPAGTAGPPIGGGGGPKKGDEDKKGVPSGWQEYTHPEGGFTIAMPTGGLPYTQPMVLGGNPANMQGFRFKDDEAKKQFTAAYAKLGQGGIAGGSEQLFESYKQVWIDAGGQVTDDKQITYAEWQGREYTVGVSPPGGTRLTLVIRAYLVQDRFIALTIQAPAVSASSPEYVNFFGSFRLAKGPGPIGDKK